MLYMYINIFYFYLTQQMERENFISTFLFRAHFN